MAVESPGDCRVVMIWQPQMEMIVPDARVILKPNQGTVQIRGLNP